MTTINPLTGRKIQIGGRTHRKVVRMTQFGGDTADSIREESQAYFDRLLSQSTEPTKPMATELAKSTADKVIPSNRYLLMGSKQPPAPPGVHSYYHHHAPFAQEFGDYVCIKRSQLRDVGGFISGAMFSSSKN